MRHPDDDGTSGPTRADSAEAARTSRRRKQTVVGVVGLAAMLGTGAFVLTDQLTANDAPPSSDTGALESHLPAGQGPENGGSAASSSAAPNSGSSRSAVGAASSAVVATSAKPKTPADRARAAKAAGVQAARNGAGIRRPLPPQNGTIVAADALTVSNSGSHKHDGSTLRIVSARQDLTGYRELAWVADKGTAVGDADCSQKFRFSADTAAKEKPTLLVCWRTSAERSVYTVMVDPSGRPSKQDSVAALDKRWAELG
jgi:hypothetical protein